MTRQLEVTFKNGEVYFYPADERGWASGVRGGRRYLLVGYAMIPEDVVERWRLVEPAPVGPVSIAEALAAGRCPGCDRPFDAAGVSCHKSAGGGWVCSRRSVEAAPDPVEVEDVVQWAERQARRCRSAFLFVDHGMATCGLPGGHAGPHEDRGLRWDDTPTTEGPGRDDTSADRCPVAANQRGVHIPCDLETDHAGRAHANREHQIIWSA